MSFGNEPYNQADIRMAEVVWSKTMKTSEAVHQQKHLVNLASGAKTGVILDCTFVDVANSELLNLLVRVRTNAKKEEKGFALFNVPENLANTIKVCKLSPVLPIATDITAAKKLAYSQATGKGGLTGKIKRMFGK